MHQKVGCGYVDAVVGVEERAGGAREAGVGNDLGHGAGYHDGDVVGLDGVVVDGVAFGVCEVGRLLTL